LSRTITSGAVTRSDDERLCRVLASHDVKQPAPTRPRIVARAGL